MIVFDIETGCLPTEALDRVKPVFEADKRLRDPVKIAEDLAAKETEWRKEAALSALTGQILCIGCIDTLVTEVPFVLEGPEAVVLEDFFDLWGNTAWTFSGFSIKNFDLPYICQRAWILGVTVPRSLMEGRYFSSRFKDLQEIWMCFGRQSKGQSLDAVCRACGIGAKNGSGADFARLWVEDKPKALEYVHNDLLLELALAKRLGVF